MFQQDFLSARDNDSSEEDVFPAPLDCDTAGQSSLFRSSSVESLISYGCLELTLSELCDTIKTRRLLASAEIISVECYYQFLGLIKHRFLLLHLRRKGKRDVYMRLDRRAAEDTGPFELVWASGKTSTRDEVNYMC